MDIATLVTLIIGVMGISIAMLFFMAWRQKNTREYEIQMQQMELEEKNREREQDERDRERYEKSESKKREEERELSKIAGGGTGGYIILDLPDDKRPLFHDLLKGFEDYAKLKGYTISFSIDATYNERIAFKFTLKDNSVQVGSEKVRQDFKEYIDKIRTGDSIDDLPVIISLEEHDLLITALKNRINFLQHSYALTQNTAIYYESLIRKIGSTPLFPAQNVLVQTGGNMDSRQYKAINSSRMIQGDDNEYYDASVDNSISFSAHKDSIILDFSKIAFRPKLVFRNF